MRIIQFILFICGMVFFSLLPAKDLWASSIYTWTGWKGIVHITETPPPSGIPVDNVMNNPPRSPLSLPKKEQSQSPSIWNWRIRQAETEVRQAQLQLEAAAENAQHAAIMAQETIQRSNHYIDTHDQNQYMRRAFKFQLKQAKNAAGDAEAKVQEALDQLKQAAEQDQAAQQQLGEALEDAKILGKSS